MDPYPKSKKHYGSKTNTESKAAGTSPLHHPNANPPLVVPENVDPGDEQRPVAHKDSAAGVGLGPALQATLLQVSPHGHLTKNIYGSLYIKQKFLQKGTRYRHFLPRIWFRSKFLNWFLFN